MSDQIRIIHVIHSGALGGGPRMLFNRTMDNAGGRLVHAVITGPDGPLASRLRDAGIPVATVPLHRKRSLPGAIPAVARLTRIWGADLITAHGQFAGTVCALARPLVKKPLLYVAAYPSFYADHDLPRRFRNAVVERTTCSAADHVVALSSLDRRTYVDRRLCPEGKIRVIHNGTPHASCDGGPERNWSNPGPLLVGFLGRLVADKGCDVLLQAVHRARTQLDLHLKLRIGGEGEERSRLEQLSRSLGLTDTVDFVGEVSDSQAFFRSIDIAVVPSRVEPFGIVAIEAMANACAVVASKVGGLSETIEDGVSGILVQPEDPDGMAEAIRALHADPSMRQHLGTAARERVRNKYTLDAYHQAYRRAYADCLGLEDI